MNNTIRDIDNYLDTHIIYIYKNDKNDMMKKLGINPNNLYSLNKKIKKDDNSSISKSKKGGTRRRNEDDLKIRTRYRAATPFEHRNIIEYINYFS